MRPRGILLLAAVLAGAAAACSAPAHHSRAVPPTSGRSATSTTGPRGGSVSASGDWTTYANGNLRWGVAGAQPSLQGLRLKWSAALDGAAIYGQPLIYRGRVFAVTEDDDVFAVDAHTGVVAWRSRVGQPLTSVASRAGCGDVDPLGITSTPVIDPATGILYAVGEVTAGAGVRHLLVGVDTSSGRIRTEMTVDPPLPPGQDSIHLLQRAALALSGSRLYIGFGGNYGDCGSYHGWIVEVDLAHHTTAAFDVTPASSGGAVWEGGAAPAIDPAGHVFITTGNPNSAGPAPYGDAVVKLSPGLGPEAGFRDPAATDDLDLGSGDTALLPDGTLVAVGKTDIAYHLGQATLAPATPITGRICGSDPDGGQAYVQATQSVYVPCRDGGLQQIDLATDSAGWRGGDVNSTPIVVDGELWAANYPTGTLEELDPATGRVQQRAAVGRPVPPFASPAAGAGVLVLGTMSGVVAFGR